MSGAPADAHYVAGVQPSTASEVTGATRRRLWSGPLVDVGIAAVLWIAALAASVQTMRVLDGHGADAHGAHVGSGALPSASAIGAWSAMSLAMMLPTAVPMLRSLADVVAAQASSQPGLGARRWNATPSPEWWSFLAAYAVVWTAVSAGFATVQALLAATGLAGGSGSTSARLLVAAALAAAGAYQFTRLKARCLTGCTRPITFLMSRWKPGLAGSWQMGLSHAVTCVGCCWALMALALVGGIHSVPFMAVATVVMVIEKLPSVGERVRVPLGLVLVGSGAAAAVLAIA
ncbi:MAG: hypothetical protein RJB61_534 [Actinomycetota bacterium]